MTSDETVEYVKRTLSDTGIEVDRIEERSFPDERWLIAFVTQESLVAAQSVAGSLEAALNANRESHSATYVVTFRPTLIDEPALDDPAAKGRLSSIKVDQLIQLLEARSRTSDALPSLHYVEDPRASLAAVGASRHQLIYGRRGVGKTALLLEAKRLAERQGHIAVWMNAHIVRQLIPAEACSVIAEAALLALVKHGGSSSAGAYKRLEALRGELSSDRAAGKTSEESIGRKLPDLNEALRSLLRDGVLRIFIYLDDFYLLPIAHQPKVLDVLAGMLRDCDGWLKVASIERLTRPFEPSTKVGLEVPHDANTIDLDVTLEDPEAAQQFLEEVLANYTTSVGLRGAGAVAKPEALGRLVLASGGVPRDYLNLLASSIVVARSARTGAREVGKEDVAVAAGSAARGKKRDLEQDVTSQNAEQLLHELAAISAYIKSEGFTYFLVNMADKLHARYELLSQLVDLRFAHLVQASLSDQHRPGLRYEAYVLALSEFADVRLKRGLNVLDLESGHWTWRLTGKARTMQRLAGTGLRDRLRQAPVLNLDGPRDFRIDA